MCSGMVKKCNCGAGKASIHNENSLPYDVIICIYCPNCSTNVEFNKDTMIADKGWIIEYDMEIAKSFQDKLKLSDNELLPDILFDKGLSCWTGFTPTDVEDKITESANITKLAKTNPKEYFLTMKKWHKERMEKLKEEGWRKLAQV